MHHPFWTDMSHTCHACEMWRSTIVPFLIASGWPAARGICDETWVRSIFRCHNPVVLRCIIVGCAIEEQWDEEMRRWDEVQRQQDEVQRQQDEAMRERDDFYAQAFAQQQIVLHISWLNYFIRYRTFNNTFKTNLLHCNMYSKWRSNKEFRCRSFNLLHHYLTSGRLLELRYIYYH
jgi:hypothetical protein